MHAKMLPSSTILAMAAVTFVESRARYTYAMLNAAFQSQASLPDPSSCGWQEVVPIYAVYAPGSNYSCPAYVIIASSANYSHRKLPLQTSFHQRICEVEFDIQQCGKTSPHLTTW